MSFSKDNGYSKNSDLSHPQKLLRALLIQPPNIEGVASLLSHMDKEGGGIGFKPPLGLLSIASYIRQNTPHDVKIIDAQAQRHSMEDCLAKVEEYRPDVVGISAWTDWWYSAYTLGKSIKKRFPEIFICYGGPHVGVYPRQTLNSGHTDVIVCGDGEVAFARLLSMVSSGIFDNELEGLHFSRFGVKEGDKLFFVQKDLDALPVPDRSLLPLENYTSILGKSKHATTMITSRGCPFQCTYCKLYFQKTVSRSAESVVEEFRRIEGLGIREVEIYDDTFTWSKQRAMAICEGLIAQGNTVSWSVRDRVNMVNEELLDAMKRSGCVRIHYGIESGVDHVLRAIKKNITIDQARKAVKLAKNKGFTVLTYFMLGNLGETVQDMRRTIDFAIELDADYAEFSIAIPYPGTEMYAQALRDGKYEDVWNSYAIRPVPNLSLSALIQSYADLDILIALRNESVRRYYFRPAFLLRELKSIRHAYEFRRKAGMGMRLLKSLLKNMKERAT